MSMDPDDEKADEQKSAKHKNVQFNSFNFDGKAAKGAGMLNGRAGNKKRQG